MNHDAPVSVTRKTSAAAPAGPGPAAARPRTAGGFWAFLRTLFIGSAGLALLAVLGTLAGSAWLTANQRAEADKPQPWADPSFTTTAVTTGGMLARFMDADGDLSNGHSYITGIYNLWKAKQAGPTWQEWAHNATKSDSLPPLWRIEIIADNKNFTESITTDRRNIIENARKEALDSRIRAVEKFSH